MNPKIKVSRFFIASNGYRDSGIWYPSVKRALEGGKQSGYHYIYRVWTIVKDGHLLSEIKELVHAYGESACTVKRADEILRQKVANLYPQYDIIFENLKPL